MISLIYIDYISLLIELLKINEGSGLVISPMSPVPVGQDVCIRSGNSTILSCMLVKDDITTNPKMYTWSLFDNNSSIITVNMDGTYVCTVSNDCGNDTAQSIVSSKTLFDTLNNLRHILQ